MITYIQAYQAIVVIEEVAISRKAGKCISISAASTQ